jgi:HAD superfamily hydrolase (TIGR01509 family)
MPTEAQSDFYSAVFFDMDGLLVDSETLWLEAETEQMAQFGYQWTPSDQAFSLGGPLDRVGNYMSDLIGGKRDGQSLMLEMIDRMIAKFEKGLSFMPGAIDLIDDLKAHGIALTLVSASPRPLVDAALSNFEVSPFVRSISCDDVKITKPDPEGYIKAALTSQSDIKNCLVFEDSLPGMQAAIDSGAWLIAVPHMVHIKESERVRSIKSLSELSFEKLKELRADFSIKI